MHPRAPRAIVPLLLLAAAALGADPWKVAGPPPASWQRDRLADLAAHRKAFAQKIGANGIAILYAAEPRNYSGDTDFPFRQENNFYYLTGIPQAGSALVIVGATKREILFIPPSNPLLETWTGHLLTPAEARERSGIEDIHDARHLNAFLRALIPQAESVFVDKPAPPFRGSRLPDPPPMPAGLADQFRDVRDLAAKGDLKVWLLTRGPAEHQRTIDLGEKLAAVAPKIHVQDATETFFQLRAIKSQREIDLLQHAVDITEEAFERVMTVAAPGVPEYEVQAQFEFTFLRRGGRWGYPCIVASGPNATILHYQTNRDTVKDGQLLLLDDAAEFDGYSADITRTLPVSGKFTKEQAEIYRLVYDAQQAAIKMAKPGHQLGNRGPDSVQGAAVEVFKAGLHKLGLITDPGDAKQVAIWFNHGIGHGIGLNVHDPAGPELAPGMVITVEPGIYIRPNALETLEKNPENAKFIEAVRPAFEKYKGIGVRLEDDLLITTGEPKIMSAAIPSKLEDVEAAMARLKRQVKTTPLP